MAKRKSNEDGSLIGLVISLLFLGLIVTAVIAVVVFVFERLIDGFLASVLVIGIVILVVCVGLLLHYLSYLIFCSTHKKPLSNEQITALSKYDKYSLASKIPNLSSEYRDQMIRMSSFSVVDLLQLSPEIDLELQKIYYKKNEPGTVIKKLGSLVKEGWWLILIVLLLTFFIVGIVKYEPQTEAVTKQIESVIDTTEGNSEETQTTETVIVVEPELEKEFIFPNSDKQRLTEEDLKDMTPEQIQLGINEIYAREGRTFKGQNGEYFASKSWYEPRYTKEEFDLLEKEIFNEYERYNIDFLVKHQGK